MNRNELVRRLVLNAISDDFENVDVHTLAGLIEDGLAKAYLLSGTAPHATELRGMPPIDIPEEYFKTYFYITNKGMDLHLFDDTWWPFDDERNLKPDWRLDPASPV